MFVCICHALTDSDVEWAMSQGASVETDVFGAHGVQPRCGKCMPAVQCKLNCRGCPRRESEREAPATAVK